MKTLYCLKSSRTFSSQNIVSFINKKNLNNTKCAVLNSIYKINYYSFLSINNNKNKRYNYPIKTNNLFISFSNKSFSYKIIIPYDKLGYYYSRSSGPGGQNVNKLNTKVEIRFNLNDADWLEEHIKFRLKELYPSKINKQGEFFILAQEMRSQNDNKTLAEKKLKEHIQEAQKPKPHRIIKQILESDKDKTNRLREKKIRSNIKSARRGEDVY